MTERRKGSRRRRPILWATLAAFAAGLVFTFAASTAPLPGSNFEIDDGNLIVNNPAPAIDWASVSEQRKADKPSGSTDDSFGQGTKEDTPVPTIVDGSIPPNKSDLLNMGFYLEENANGRFLNLFWHRVQEPQGTTNMDFEFNKSSTLSANGVTPVRTAGDVLIQYDLSQGGTNPQLFASRWVASGAGSQCEASNSTPCWGTRVNLTAAGVATGSINTSPIPVAQSDGLAIDIDGDGTLDPISTRTFGEAQVDLNALTGGGSPACVVFGSAYLKSRSSDSFTAALKDFIAPLNLNLDNCGNVIIRKVTIPASDPATVQFGYTKSFPTDPATANTFTLGHGQSKNYGDDVIPGTGYTVVEDVIPANWAFTSIDCSASSGVTPTIVGAQITFDINDTSDVLDCTYTNTQLKGAIKVTKTRKHAADGTGDHPHAGVNFTVNGVTKATDANGVACFDGLNFGAYTVHEVVPAGYHGEADKQVTVDNNATCAATPYAGESVSFHNTPLTNITVTVDSQVAGGTSSTIDCDPVTPGPDAGPGDDISHSLNDREPGTYTCTVVVDP
jgi:Prealbumin-like fold domain